jgi:hypothetical protein
MSAHRLEGRGTLANAERCVGIEHRSGRQDLKERALCVSGNDEPGAIRKGRRRRPHGRGMRELGQHPGDTIGIADAE